MIQPPSLNEADISEELLNKADALIKRNRPDGVGSESEELPMLTEVIDDLPELTDVLEFMDVPKVMELEDEEVEPGAAGLSSDQVNILINDAIERTQRDMLKHQDRAIQDALDRARTDNPLALQNALAQGRKEGREEAHKEGFALGMSQGRVEGRNESLTQHQLALESARQEIHRKVVLQFSERLIELDAYISQAIDGWLTRELPHVIAGELDNVAERIRVQTAAHMRATLLPELSDKLSALLDAKPL